MSPSLLDVAKQNPFSKPDANAAGAKLVEFGSTEVGFQISATILIGWIQIWYVSAEFQESHPRNSA